MNLNNVNKAIAVMERVKARGSKLNLCSWSTHFIIDENGNPAVPEPNEQAYHNCGSVACFAGWVAISPEFKEDGGFFDYSGRPYYNDGHAGADAIMKWLDISEEESCLLCYVGQCIYGTVYPNEGESDVDDVLEVLYRLRDTGTVKPKNKFLTAVLKMKMVIANLIASVLK